MQACGCGEKLNMVYYTNIHWAEAIFCIHKFAADGGMEVYENVTGIRR